MKGIKVYRAAEGMAANDFGRNGWDIINPMYTGGFVVVYKPFEIPRKSEIYEVLIQAYNSTGWQASTIGVDNTKPKEGFFWDLFNDMGLKFVPDGSKWRIDTDDEETERHLREWRVEVDFGDADRLVRISPYDVSFPNPLYAASTIRTYKGSREIVDEAMGKGLIVENTFIDGSFESKK